MPVRLTHIHKAHQPGDLASFSADETRAIVLAGHGTVVDPADAAEQALYDIQRAAVAEVGTARSRGLDPSLRPAAGAGSAVADHLLTTPTLERPSATPMPGDPIDPRHASFAADHERLGDPYLAALRRVMAEGTPVYAGLADDELARRIMRLDLDETERARVAVLRGATGDDAPDLDAMGRPELEETALLLFRDSFGRDDDDGLRGGVRALLRAPAEIVPQEPEKPAGEGEGGEDEGGEGGQGGQGANDPPLLPPPDKPAKTDKPR